MNTDTPHRHQGLLGMVLPDEVNEGVVESVASVEQIARRHGRTHIASGLGTRELRFHRQLVIVQVLHAVQVLGLFLRSNWKAVFF